MKYVIRVVLLIAIAVLAYLTYNSIAEPVRYAKQVEKNEQLVIDKLSVIRDAQVAFRQENNRFTASFDTLIDFMQNGKMKIIVQYGSEDDSTTVYRTEEEFIPIKDSLFKDVDIENIRYVPLLDDKTEFIMNAKTIVSNNATVPVFEVIDPQPFSRERKAENNPLKVGSIVEVNYRGNWKRR
ncbi:MAG: hypothetical protein HKP14_07760 [Bacteroidia bacterium]|nr:hypothetical protein [Bacteroidia bacterium]